VCAVGAAALRYAARPLDRRVERIEFPREARLVLAAAVVVALLVGAALANAPRRISDARATFTQGQYMKYSDDLRTRLTSAVDNGRIDNWRIALEGFEAHPFRGTGAGTYRLTWDRERPAPPVKVNDGHSLYLETMSEMGVVGLVAVLTVLGTILIGGVLRLGGPERHAHGAFVAAGTMLAIHAGIDWDWEMPAVTAWFFAVGGAALAGRASKRRLQAMGDRGRVPIAAALLVVAVTPALLMLSQYKLQAAARSFDKGSCRSATKDAVSSINVLGNRPQAYQIVGYCDIDAGRAQEAVASFRKAVEQEPGSWEYHFGLAIAQGFAGSDPRAELAEAARLNPKEELVLEGQKALAGKSTPEEWLAAAKQLNDDTRVSGRLTLR
jgi:cell division protein ZapA (FtsZ GTPase activity inhibitor)